MLSRKLSVKPEFGFTERTQWGLAGSSRSPGPQGIVECVIVGNTDEGGPQGIVGYEGTG